MRDRVESFAIGHTDEVLEATDSQGRVKLISDAESAMETLILAWEQGKTAAKDKAIIAGVLEVAALNKMARQRVIQRGLADESAAVDLDIERRDGSREVKRFTPSDRIVFTFDDARL